MSLFGLDPESVVSRIEASGRPARVPSLRGSLVTGTLGFTVASLVVYGSWALNGRDLYRALGEAGAYAVWAVLFIALAGGLLNPLVIGPRSLFRFYALFAAAFMSYAVLWSVSWFVARGRVGEWLGSLLGSAALALVLSTGFGLTKDRWRLIFIVFATHSAGYFLGSWLYDVLAKAGPEHWLVGSLDRSTRSWVSKLSWGLAHGLGLGGGIAYAIFAVQRTVRERLRPAGS